MGQCQKCPSQSTEVVKADHEGTGAAASRNQIDLGVLHERLMAVEGQQLDQDVLFETLQTQGAAMIVTVGIDETDQVRLLQIFKYMRALFAMNIWSEDVCLVKADGPRFFIFAVSAGKALRAAFAMKLLVAQLHSWIGDVCPELGALKKAATFKAGIHSGGILLIEEDCFGDPVNVASKLGEDLAQAGEIMVSMSAMNCESDDVMQVLKASCKLADKKTEISGTTLEYFLTEDLRRADAIGTPSKAETENYLDVHGGHGAMKAQSLVILTTDMSGFTRLTKAYGILHFLRLVLNTRGIMLPAMEKVGGWKIKYEGDNIIAAFPNADGAILCIRSCMEQVAEFNKTREKDFQLRIGYSLDVGEVKIVGHDIVGPAFDCSFLLAEDIAEVGELLVTERIKLAMSGGATKLSEEKKLEATGDKYYALSFL